MKTEKPWSFIHSLIGELIYEDAAKRFAIGTILHPLRDSADLNFDAITSIKSASLFETIKLGEGEKIYGAIMIDPYFEPWKKLRHLTNKNISSRGLCTAYLIPAKSDAFKDDVQRAIDLARSFSPFCALILEENIQNRWDEVSEIADIFSDRSIVAIQAFDGTDYIIWKRE